VKATDLLTSASITAIPNLSSAGEVRMAMAGAAGIPSGNGPLLQITFDVLASATPGTYELGLAAALWDESGMAMPATVARGSVTVKAKSGKAAGEGVLSLGMAPSYPNPFNSTTVIPYQVAQPGHVRLAIYNLAGQRVRLLVDGAAEPGSYLAVWNGLDELGREAGTGTYLCALQAGTGRATRALLLMR
jgi:hypothetical protein